MNKTLSGLCGLMFGMVFACTAPVQPPPGPMATNVPVQTDVRPTHSPLSDVPVATFWTSSYSESVELDGTLHQVLLLGAERDPTQDQSETVLPAPYETWEKAYSVSYSPSAATFRTGNEIYVAGKKADGTTIIERWDFPHIQGMYYSQRASLWPSVPFGTPLTTGPLGVGIQGGTYVLPALRPAPVPNVVTIYSGTSLGWINALSVDPDGRFLLAIESSAGGQLVQLRLTTPQTIHVIASDSQYPGLLQAGAPTAIDQSQSGRLYFTLIDDHVFWVEDPTNDGILDGISTLGFREFHIAFPKVTWSMVYP